MHRFDFFYGPAGRDSRFLKLNLQHDMDITGYLILRKKSQYSVKARFTATTPALQPNEVAVKIKIVVPAELFQRPQLNATITIPPEAVMAPVIDAAVTDNIAEAIKTSMGIDLRIEVVPQPAQ